ncbi:hypothetical protein MTO96_031637 [Rhipicephalus appendiculatus]
MTDTDELVQDFKRCLMYGPFYMLQPLSNMIAVSSKSFLLALLVLAVVCSMAAAQFGFGRGGYGRGLGGYGGFGRGYGGGFGSGIGGYGRGFGGYGRGFYG